MGGAQWYRQKPIGNYIVDFYCPSASRIIEVDGGQHYEKEGIEKDNERNLYSSSLGLQTLRFTNVDVLKNIEGVLIRIEEVLRKSLR
ncbi:MAG: hypothetical protein G01um101433_301 [Parcubacteria group bacterium Gr01-1014_33]|nr:MAG: hypothetical protein G01um101433_301 [Parcubacteria group bacterium Gr01-1014_33]